MAGALNPCSGDFALSFASFYIEFQIYKLEIYAGISRLAISVGGNINADEWGNLDEIDTSFWTPE